MSTNIEIRLNDADVAALRARTGIKNPTRALAAWINRARAEQRLHPDTLRSVLEHESGRVRWSRNADELFETLNAEATRTRNKAA